MARRKQMGRGSLVVETIESRVLRRNKPGDPTVRHFPVYLPPEYEESAPKRYPVLLALTGFSGTGRMLLNVSAWGEPLNERLDRLLHERKIGPMIVAMPDCFTRYGGSQYLNSSATGRYADHLLDEVLPHLDQRFRTLPGPRHHGVFGKSSGGYGALMLGMQHPDVLGAVACQSGDMGFEYCYLPEFPAFLTQMARDGGPQGFLDAFDRASRKTGAQFTALNVLAMSACYSPNPRRRPLGIDFPMDLETGALDRAVWARWLDRDPVRCVARFARNLKRLRLLYLDCGTRDEFHLIWGARQLVTRLRKLRVRHVYEEFDDGHRDLSYRYDCSLPRLWEALGTSR